MAIAELRAPGPGPETRATSDSTHNPLSFCSPDLPRAFLLPTLFSGQPVEENHVDGTQDCPDRYVSSIVVRCRAGRSDWRGGGTVSWPAAAKDRLFLSLHYQRTVRRSSDGGGWLVALRTVCSWLGRGMGPGPVGICVVSAWCSWRRQHISCSFCVSCFFSSLAHHPASTPVFFSSTNKQQADAVPSAALPLPTVPERSPRSLVPLSTSR